MNQPNLTHFILSERTLIGAVMFYAASGDNTITDKCGGSALTESFSNPTLRALWALLCARRAEGVPNTLVEVGAAVMAGCVHVPGSTGDPVRVTELAEWLERFRDMDEQSKTPSTYKYCADQIRSAHMRRKKLVEHQCLLERINNDPSPIESWYSESLNKLDRTNCLETSASNLDAELDNVGAYLAGLPEHGKFINSGVSSGLVELDDYVGGFEPMRLIVIAGRPGQGKSALGVQIAVDAARRGEPALIVSLEMGRQQLLRRIVARSAGINSMRLSRGPLPPAMRAASYAAIEGIRRIPLRIEQGIDKWDEIERICRLAVADGTKLVVIDYAQLVKVDAGKNTQGWEKIAIVSGAAKQLAIKLNIPIILLAQLNRDSVKANARPALHNLGGGDSLGRDADIVLMIHREDAEDGSVADRALIMIEKNRDGGTGSFIARWLPEFTSFANMIEPTYFPTEKAYEKEQADAANQRDNSWGNEEDPEPGTVH